MLTNAQMMGEHGYCATLTVKLKKHDNAVVVINAHDFNEDDHEKTEMAAIVESLANEASVPDFDDMNKDELKQWLDKKGVSYSSGDSKSDLVELCKSHV